MSTKPDLSMSFWNYKKSRIKKKILEEAKVGGKHLMYRGAKIRITSNFSLETMQARKSVEWSISHHYTTSLKLSQEHELYYWMAHNVYFSSLRHHFHPSPDVHCLENNFFHICCHLLYHVMVLNRNAYIHNSQWYCLLKFFVW